MTGEPSTDRHGRVTGKGGYCAICASSAWATLSGRGTVRALPPRGVLGAPSPQEYPAKEKPQVKGVMGSPL